jgi:hypothetical protein
MSVVSLKRVAALAVGVVGVAVAVAVPAAARHGGGSGASSCMGTLDPSDAGTITWSPAVIWPPNHKLVPVTISWTENSSSPADNDSNTLKVTGITSTGPDGPGSGSGQPTAKQGPDFTGVGNSATAPDGTPATVTVDVRAERAGTDKAGRTYTIQLSCQSGSEPAGSSMAVVTVPHDMGNNTTSSSSSTSSGSSTAASLTRLP